MSNVSSSATHVNSNKKKNKRIDQNKTHQKVDRGNIYNQQHNRVISHKH